MSRSRRRGHVRDGGLRRWCHTPRPSACTSICCSSYHKLPPRPCYPCSRRGNDTSIHRRHGLHAPRVSVHGASHQHQHGDHHPSNDHDPDLANAEPEVALGLSIQQPTVGTVDQVVICSSRSKGWSLAVRPGSRTPGGTGTGTGWGAAVELARHPSSRVCLAPSGAWAVCDRTACRRR